MLGTVAYVFVDHNFLFGWSATYSEDNLLLHRCEDFLLSDQNQALLVDKLAA